MSTRNDGPKGIEALLGIDQGLGQIFEGLKEAIKTAELKSGNSDTGSDGDRNGFEKTTSFGTPGSGFSGVSSFRMRTNIAGKNQTESASDDIVARSRVKKTPPQAQQAKTPQASRNDAPLARAEVFKETGGVLVVVEISSLSEADLDISSDGKTIALSSKLNASNKQIIDLLSTYDASGMTQQFRNGILEIRLPNLTPANLTTDQAG